MKLREPLNTTGCVYLWEVRRVNNMAFFRLGIQDVIPTLHIGLQSVPLGFIFGISSTGVFLWSVTVLVFKAYV